MIHTLAQESFLREYGLEPLPTEAASDLLINFIKNGNATCGNTASERVAIWRKACADFVGKRVTDQAYTPNGPRMQGTIGYLLPRSMTEVRSRNSLDYMLIGRTQTRAPFKFYVKWDAGKGTIVAYSSVKIDGVDNPDIKLSGNQLVFTVENKNLYVVQDGEQRFCLWFKRVWHMNRYGFRGDCAKGAIPLAIFKPVFEQFKVWAAANAVPHLDGMLCEYHK